MPTTWRALTGDGYFALIIGCFRRDHLEWAKLPLLFGHIRIEAAVDRKGVIRLGVVEANIDAELDLGGDEPAKSVMISPLSASMVTAALITTSSPPGTSKIGFTVIGAGFNLRMAARVASSERSMIRSESSCRSSRLCRSHSAAMRSAPIRPAETWAARSPMTCSGSRTLDADNVKQRLVGLSRLVEFQQGNPETLFVYVTCARAHAIAADIGVMNARADVADEFVTIEDRREHRDVEEMRGGLPRIVCDELIARLERVRRKRL